MAVVYDAMCCIPKAGKTAARLSKAENHQALHQLNVPCKFISECRSSVSIMRGVVADRWSLQLLSGDSQGCMGRLRLVVPSLGCGHYTSSLECMTHGVLRQSGSQQRSFSREKLQKPVSGALDPMLRPCYVFVPRG